MQLTYEHAATYSASFTVSDVEFRSTSSTQGISALGEIQLVNYIDYERILAGKLVYNFSVSGYGNRTDSVSEASNHYLSFSNSSSNSGGSFGTFSISRSSLNPTSINNTFTNTIDQNDVTYSTSISFKETSSITLLTYNKQQTRTIYLRTSNYSAYRGTVSLTITGTMDIYAVILA